MTSRLVIGAEQLGPRCAATICAQWRPHSLRARVLCSLLALGVKLPSEPAAHVQRANWVTQAARLAGRSRSLSLRLSGTLRHVGTGPLLCSPPAIMMSTAASTPAVACLARPSQAKLAQRSSGLAGRPLQAAGCRKGSAALGRGAAVCAVEGDAPMVGSDPSKLTVSLPAALNIDDIMARLPHRFPFLLVSYGARNTSCGTSASRFCPARVAARDCPNKGRTSLTRAPCVPPGGQDRGVGAWPVRHRHQERDGAPHSVLGPCPPRRLGLSHLSLCAPFLAR